MAKANTDLVIVESPAKAKTIAKYLGPGYQVTASMGHLRDLPKSKLGVDIEHDFQPQYVPVKGREDVIADLTKKAKAAGTVFLATDPDREGEAISWHLREMLQLPDEKARRVTFNEITRRVVQESIANPRDINQNLVDAQQARRILDRIVGYKLSPLLWRKIRRGLSAGRVQSVATRMVVDRENEIKAFVPAEYWLLDAQFARQEKAGEYTARFHGTTDGTTVRKMELHSEQEVDAVVAAVDGQPFQIVGVKPGQKQHSPAPPFITSTLQQEASRRLGMTPRRTMSVAQQLYEGVDIEGEGTIGLITYMRTDSLRLSEDALTAAGGFIRERYGDAYYGGPRRYRAKAGAQDAHEAIRPSIVTLTPERVKKDLTGEQYRLYRLIWSRFIASQMTNAIYDSLVIDTAAAGYLFRANRTQLRFAGYTAVYEEGRDDEEEESRKPLPDLRQGEEVLLRKMDRQQKFTQPPARYTEATLIHAMEEKGIGRPSTYAPTITTILAREYVVKEGKNLRPTILGEVVTKLMQEHFPDIVDLKFTANMESELDGIEEGKTEWHGMLRAFYDGFDRELEQAEEAMAGERIKIPDEESDELCDVCGRRMVIKSGRFGRFLACPGYPECSFTKPLVVEMPGKCPLCGGRILKRTSKKGYTYYGCEHNSDKTERHCQFMTWDVPVKETCPECGHTLFKKAGRGQRKPFCINEACPAFVPEEKRGGYRKKAAQSADAPAEAAQAPADAAEAASAPAQQEQPAEKPARGKKTAAKKEPAEKKTTTAKKTTAKKTATAETAAKKTTAAKRTRSKTEETE